MILAPTETTASMAEAANIPGAAMYACTTNSPASGAALTAELLIAG
jgi:hypothetical protein